MSIDKVSFFGRKIVDRASLDVRCPSRLAKCLARAQAIEDRVEVDKYQLNENDNEDENDYDSLSSSESEPESDNDQSSDDEEKTSESESSDMENNDNSSENESENDNSEIRNENEIFDTSSIDSPKNTGSNVDSECESVCEADIFSISPAKKTKYDNANLNDIIDIEKEKGCLSESVPTTFKNLVNPKVPQPLRLMPERGSANKTVSVNDVNTSEKESENEGYGEKYNSHTIPEKYDSSELRHESEISNTISIDSPKNIGSNADSECESVCDADKFGIHTANKIKYDGATLNEIVDIEKEKQCQSKSVTTTYKKLVNPKVQQPLRLMPERGSAKKTVSVNEICTVKKRLKIQISQPLNMMTDISVPNQKKPFAATEISLSEVSGSSANTAGEVTGEVNEESIPSNSKSNNKKLTANEKKKMRKSLNEASGDVVNTAVGSKNDRGASGEVNQRSKPSKGKSKTKRLTTKERKQKEKDENDALWSEDPTPPVQIPFTGEPGLQVNVPESWMGFLQLFLMPNLIDFLLKETNGYANYCKMTNKPKCKGKWTNITKKDIANYLGMRILMGIIRLPRERMYWSKNPYISIHAIYSVMAYTKFALIQKYLHSFNSFTRPKDNTNRLLLVNDVIEYVRKRCHDVYLPEMNLSLDEGLLGWKGRLSFKVYAPKKPTKYGIKIYMLCEAKTGYVLDYIVYRGESHTLKEIVNTLLERFYFKGYRVYMDNFYNSVSLSEELYSKGIHTTGTLRLFKGGPPSVLQDLKDKKLDRDTLHYRRKGNTFVMCWYDQRLVPMISNIFGPETQKTKVIRKDKKKGAQEYELNKPVAILNYNQYMQGVDLFDQKIGYYNICRRTVKWSKKMLFYQIQLCIQNAHTLYSKFSTDEKKLSLLEFHTNVATALLNFMPEQWPSDSTLDIPHAPNLSDAERYHSPRKNAASTLTSTNTPVIPQCHLPKDVPIPASTTSTSCAGPSSANTSDTITVTGSSADTPSSTSVSELQPPFNIPIDSAAIGVETPKKRTRIYHPLSRIVDKVAMQHMPKRISNPRGLSCVVCYKNKDSKNHDTSYECKMCHVPLCKPSSDGRECWTKYHTDPNLF